MATNQVLQWQSFITDSTDREAILSNLDVLEQFAGAITGYDKSIQDNFAAIRKGIKNGSIKPTNWKSSKAFTDIITKLTDSSSGEITNIKTALDTAKGDIKDHGDKLNEQEKRIKDAVDKLGNKLDTSTFDSFKASDFKDIKDWKSAIDKKIPSFVLGSELEEVKTLINNEVSHWTAEGTPAPLEYKTLAELKSFKQPWEASDNPEWHIGDLCTVIGEGQKDRGVSYRFVTNPPADSYKWLKVIDNDGVLALQQHSEFLQKYNQRQKTIDDDSSNKQKAIDDLVKKLKGTDGGLDQLGKNFAEEQRKAEEERRKAAERDRQYKVVVTTKGYIKDGAIVDGESDNGTPVIVHTAHVYDNFGKEQTIAARGKLTWTINKGRKTAPIEKTITGLVCKVSKEQFVKDGTTPPYYNIELNSTF